MKLIEFPEHNAVIAKDQPEYNPMPAHIDRSTPECMITCCWKLSIPERLELLLTGKLWQQMMSFHQPIQPQLLSVNKPKLQPEDAA